MCSVSFSDLWRSMSNQLDKKRWPRKHAPSCEWVSITYLRWVLSGMWRHAKLVQLVLQVFSFCCLSFSHVAVLLYLSSIFCIANVVPWTKTSWRSCSIAKGCVFIAFMTEMLEVVEAIEQKSGWLRNTHSLISVNWKHVSSGETHFV